MPELPEVETVVRTLRPLLVGRTITDFQLYWPRTLQATDAEEFRLRIAGETIVSIARRAKYIVLEVAGGERITVHLRMTGELLFVASAFDQTPAHRLPYLRAKFELDGGASLLFFDTRKFGRVRPLTVEQWTVLDKALGIEPLSTEFTPAALRRILQDRKRQMKPLLLDQTVIAGLGNIYVDESLYLARVHPLQASDAVSRMKAGALHEAIVNVLQEAVTDRGTTLRDYRGGAGKEGEHQFRLHVYGSAAGRPCPRCGAGLQRIVVGQRGTVFCPRCQRMTLRRNTPSR
jgi:formamidopyrimidine-DNA glycosylase